MIVTQNKFKFKFASIDFTNLVGTSFSTINITEGSFSGAIDGLTFSENVTVNPNLTALLNSQALVSGSFQTSAAVLDWRNDIALVGLGVLGIWFLLRRLKLRIVD